MSADAAPPKDQPMVIDPLAILLGLAEAGAGANRRLHDQAMACAQHVANEIGALRRQVEKLQSMLGKKQEAESHG